MKTGEETLKGNTYIVNGTDEELEKYQDKVYKIWQDMDRLYWKIFGGSDDVKYEILGTEMTYKELMDKVFGNDDCEITCSVDDAIDYLRSNEDIDNYLNYNSDDLRLAIEYIRYFGI